MNTVTIMQGDAYPLSVILETGASPMPTETVGEMEMSVGPLVKTLTAGGITYDEATGTFTFPLTQEETLAMASGVYKVQLRVKAYDGTVIGTDVGEITVCASNSKAVL